MVEHVERCGGIQLWQRRDRLIPDVRSAVLKQGSTPFCHGKKPWLIRGSYQAGLGAKLLRSYRWWEFAPHPEWVSPAGTTLLEPNDKVSGFNLDLIAGIARIAALADNKKPPRKEDLPLGEWHDRRGNWRLPYAAGIPGRIRFIYLPYFGFGGNNDPTFRSPQASRPPGIRYHAYYWQPALGIKIDLGVVERGVGDNAGKVSPPRGDRKLYDARGEYRGELRGTVWDRYGTNQKIEGDTYQPAKPPTIGDWVLVLAAQNLYD